ncbi:energy transducer TonB family protein [Rhodovulum euryhalinum]|uniref:Outer membrane transport energization protein TonB n=1 Tax=Rhodovulum euryhalinum TaxID=35805 RepID=A0A4R2KUW3_9RHOB|nr:energy transducer TonB [Rhodovulum euryhalinum]TCO70505.1 outer membrane transport energization protein TonB [Rhodovulum euryhalinum]
MRRLAELSLFLPLAAGLHAAAFGLFSGSEGGAGGGGSEAGEGLVTLAAAPPALSRLAEDWSAPPEVAAVPPELARPAPAAPPRLPAPEAGATRPAAPEGPVSPRADSAPPALPPPPAIAPPPATAPLLAAPPSPDAPVQARQVSDRPARAPGLRAPDLPRVEPPPPEPAAPPPRAERRPEAAPPSAPAQTAAGSARASSAGAPARAAPALSPAALRALRAEWGGQILARVARAHRYPRGTRATGRALVDLEVTREGRVVAVRLVQGTGDPVLDRAALDAIRRAAPYPAAPGGLDAGSYGFTVPLKFDGRR